MLDLKYFKTKFKEIFIEKSMLLSADEDQQNSFFIAGTDEVGRGPLAGPVVAACVSLHFKKYEEKELRLLLKEWAIFGINDSKKLSSEKRQNILTDLSFLSDSMSVDQIYTYQYSKNMSVKVLIKEISPQIIDEINILNASLLAMKEAVTGCCDFSNLGLVLIDGNKKFNSESGSVELITIIQGDSKSLLIGLASIIAKEYRDQLMTRYCEQYPGYHWKTNAGYGTAKHLEAISLLGITDLHRKTFGGVKEHYEKRG
ncbi:MAG: ribonuclease HII [Bacteriovorax sp.]|nr:ribonuclease HII [Bacteriovorax sp.]